MQRFFTLLLLFTVSFTQAQDLTGVWQGHFRSGNAGMHSSLLDDRYKLEIQIAQHEKTVDAVTYSYLSSIFYGKAATSGMLNPRNSKVLLQETRLLEVRNQSGDVCLMTYFLQYSKSGDDEFLEGTYVSMNMRDSSNCGKGTVFLHKVAASDFYKEPFLAQREKELEDLKKKNAAPSVAPRNPTPPVTAHNPASASTPGNTAKKSTASSAPAKKTAEPPALAHAGLPASSGAVQTDSTPSVGKNFAVITPRVLQTRANVLVKSLVLNTTDVVLNIYDDGAIDHDTVSVYLDKRMVINHAMLTDRPLVVNLHLDDNQDFHELILVADNEGEIPPNTSLMIVKAADKEYEVRITTTEQKNALITFKYEKK